MLPTYEIKSLVCESCWKDVFDTTQYGKVCVGGDRGSSRTDSLKAKKTVRQIRESMRTGCSWCSFLWTFISSAEYQKYGNAILEITLAEFVPYYSTPIGRNALYLDLSWVDAPRVLGIGWSLRLHAFAESTDPVATFVTARRFQEEVHSDASKSQIQEWLTECGTHRQCSSQSEVTLPTRVIEVNPEDPSGRPRILVTSGKQGKYIALSYCWGGDQHVKLKKTNLDAYTQELDLGALPQAIRDAIQVTQSMGVPYLWVDSLCILQDSEVDKQHELPTMKRVFRDSLVTIVVACSEKVTDGFLQPRRKVMETYNVPFRIGTDQFGTVSLVDMDDVELDESREQIHLRAWTLQENLLPSRFLIYSSHTLQWRCQADTLNLGDSYHLLSYSDEDKYSESLRVLNKPSSSTESELKRWLRILNVYSSRCASLSNDKLNALSAVAESFQAALGPHYYAGIWQFAALWQLLWVPLSSWNSDVINTRPVDFRAPSWSWASVDGALCYDTFLLEDEIDHELYRCSMINCETVPKAANYPFGELLAGSMTIRGVLRKAWLKPSIKKVLWLAESDETLEAAEAPQSDGSSPADSGEDESGIYQQKDIGYHDEGRGSPPILVHCLPIASTRQDISHGLLLVASRHNLYRRIGSFEAARKDSFDHLPQQNLTLE